VTPTEAAELIRTHKLVCRRCHRECEPWPLHRAARCSPAHWALCIAPAEDCDVVAASMLTDVAA